MIQQVKLRTMILKETAASMLWHELSSVEKAAYVAANPSSKFASAAIHIKHPGRYHEQTMLLPKLQSELAAKNLKDQFGPIMKPQEARAYLQKTGLVLKKAGLYEPDHAKGAKFIQIDHGTHGVRPYRLWKLEDLKKLGLHQHAITAEDIGTKTWDTKIKALGAAIHIKHPGRYHEHTGVPEGEKIPISIINKDIKDGSPEVKKEARFAKNARAWKH